MKIIRSLALVLSLLLFTSCSMAEDVLNGAQPNWLIANLGTADVPDYCKIAEIQIPDGFVLADGVTGLNPELYYAPEDEESPLRFVYYTTGNGDCLALAHAAAENYSAFYDEFEPGEIEENSLGDRYCVQFAYTCAYPGPDGTSIVYEQTLLCYFPLEGDAFVAMILSQAFDAAEEYLSRDDLLTQSELFTSAIVWEQ